jgi:hypothetical protein
MGFNFYQLAAMPFFTMLAPGWFCMYQFNMKLHYPAFIYNKSGTSVNRMLIY